MSAIDPRGRVTVTKTSGPVQSVFIELRDSDRNFECQCSGSFGHYP